MRSFFWGIFLLSSGLFLILKHYFNWNVPTVRVLIGLFLISLGLSLLIGGPNFRIQTNMFLDQGRLDISPGEKDYNIVFGEGILDLSDTSMDELADKIDVNVVFGSAKIILPRDAAVSIKANSAFASVQFPDDTNLTFGDRTYLSDPGDKGQADLILHVNTVFGSTEIVY